MGPTHIFNSPLDELVGGFQELLDGANECEILWYDEPGAYIWTVSRDMDMRHIVTVKIDEYADLDPGNVDQKENREIIKTTEFTVKLKSFCICLLKQLEKLDALMKEKSYQRGREDELALIDINRFKTALAGK